MMHLVSRNYRVAFLALLALLFPAGAAEAQQATASAVPELKAWLKDRELNDVELESVSSQPFAAAPLTREAAQSARQLLWAARREFLLKDRKAEMDAREISLAELKMPFWYKIFGDAPAEGRSLYISMHGGGGTLPAVNDGQYENQKGLYKPKEGVYLVPRAATDTWNLWHESHIDQFLDRLITDMIVFENVNPNRVYIMGYSAGGDGVYQLAPRMADRFAAAAMMAGHPNESRPEGLRNIGFTIHMGANDSGYNRNSAAAQWGKKLDDLQAADPGGYVHEVTLHEGRGHWMNLQDAVALTWMAKFDRNSWPEKIVWVQDDVLHSRFYWLKVPADSAKAGDEVAATVEDNTIRIEKSSPKQLTVLLDDRLLDLDRPVGIILPDGTRSEQAVIRTIANLALSLGDRNDPESLSCGAVDISLP